MKIQTSLNTDNIEIVDVAVALNECRVDIENDIYSYHLSDNQCFKDIESIVYHYILHSICERIRYMCTTKQCIVVHQLKDRLEDFISVPSSISSRLTLRKIFIFISRCIPARSYIYDGRYGDIHNILQDSGEFREIIIDARSRGKRSCLRSAIEMSRNAGLTYMHKDYFTQPSIKMLFYK
jgi:hypothetical protein